MSASGEIINDDELALRRAEEAAARRAQAAQWLRKMDQCASKTLSNDPSEEEFCIALRNGLILCNVLNRVNPGAVSKVVESPLVSVESPEAAAHSVIQYFENVRNFLVAVSEMKLLTFEASDLEKGGSSVKVVDCILCLEGYHEWKLAGGIGVWRYGGIVKITSLNRAWPSPFLGVGSADESYYDSSFQHEHFAEVVHLLTVDLLEESIIPNALGSVFDQFGLQLLYAFLAEWSGADDFPLNPTLVDMVLDQALNEFYMLLVSQRNLLGSLLIKILKHNSGCASKVAFMEAVLRHLKEKSCGSPSCLKFCICRFGPKVISNVRVDFQQRQLEKLKLSFHDMKVQVECSQKKWAEDLQKFEKHMEGLNVNASLFYKLLEENRMLYNQVQDLRGNIRVYCRVRPFLATQSDNKSTVDHIGENGRIMILDLQKQGKDARKIFSFNKVFGANTTQHEVYVDTQPLIRSVMDGYNVCIFAYGQTGSGKTYTMSGPDLTTEETWGVNYRALNDLFHVLTSRVDAITYDVSVQMIEIYNEQVRDLLVSDGSNRRLEIRNNSQLNGLNIPDASLISVYCTQDVLDLLKTGQRNRAVGATALNDRSSRSHSVLTVHVQGRELVSGSILRGCLHLVDLAGSERVNKSEAAGERLKEAQHINRSLSALGDVISALAQKSSHVPYRNSKLTQVLQDALGERLKEAQHINRSLSALGDVISALAQKSSHVPYRNSKLTQVLQDALGGQAKTLMFVHVNPEINSFGETISTLKFAERVASIELGAARANKETRDVRDLKEEISELKSALEVKESEVEQLKIYTCRLTAEVKNLRNASPLHSQKHGSSLHLKPESTQQLTSDSRQIESRSCSSGKQRKSRFPTVSEKEQGSKSPLCASESRIKSRKRTSPSPIRRSVSSDRAAVIKTKPRIQTIDEKPILKLHFPEKISVKKFTNVKTVLSNGRTRSIFSEREEEHFKPTLAMRKKLEARKNCDFSETENEFNTRSRSPVSRISQSIEPRTSFRTLEHENRAPNNSVRNGKEGRGATEPETGCNRSLSRGKFTLS